MQKIVSREEYNNAMTLYWAIVNELPEYLQELFPVFDYFMSPANYTRTDLYEIELSITGTKRLDMLNSPHASALLAAWAAQRLPDNDR